MKSYAKLSATFALTGAAPAYAGGLPQLDPTWFGNQVLWLVVTFIALYAIVSFFIAPTVNSILTARESAIGDAIRDAEEAKRTAEDTRTHFESAGQSARTKAAEFTAQAQAEISRDNTAAMAKLDTELARKTEQADNRISEAKAKAVAGMQDSTVAIAKAMADKLLGEAVPAADIEKTVSRLAKAK